jgi:hypothetical protein
MRPRTALLAVLMSGMICGCAGDTRSASAGHSGGLAHAGAALTRARALAFAQAVNLTASDLPGFTVAPRREGESATEARLQRRLLACVGSAAFGDQLVEAKSKSFELKRAILDLSVSSEVGVAQTAALAAAQLAAIRSARVRGCFSAYLDSLMKGRRPRGAAVSPVSISAGSPPAPGTTGTFGLRITATFTIARARLSLYVDILGFVLGHARVTLVSSGTLRPFPAAIQERLFSLLLSRARAQAP